MYAPIDINQTCGSNLLNCAFRGEDDRYLHETLPVTAFLKLSTKPVTTRVTTATRAGCVQRGLVREMPGTRRGSRNAPAEDDPRHSILQLNTEGLTTNKISNVEQLAYKNKAFIIVLQETNTALLQAGHWFPTFHYPGQSWALTTALPRLSMSGWNGHWSISLHNNQRLSGCAWTSQDIRL